MEVLVERSHTAEMEGLRLGGRGFPGHSHTHSEHDAKNIKQFRNPLPPRTITKAQIKAIRQVPHFKDSHYASLDLNKLLEFYYKNFARRIPSKGFEAKGSIADIGTGYGWLAIALALNTENKIYAVDFSEARIQAARKIAAIMGVAEQITWVTGTVGQLPFADQSFDIVFCVEVIEHVSDRPEIAREIGRVTRKTLTITTPNKISPVILHDTCLPFCHWLPPRMRNGYAALFGRSALQDNNLFWSPWRLCGALPEFKRESSFLRLLLPNLAITFRRAG
jgi:2-polyprenyl-3-methyl-5-hydroxy-6-metoxy-1,4-benzoquinol methylase